MAAGYHDFAPTKESSRDHSEPNQVARGAAYSMSNLSNLLTC